jgi:hypothetical protein
MMQRNKDFKRRTANGAGGNNNDLIEKTCHVLKAKSKRIGSYASKENQNEKDGLEIKVRI